MADQIAAEHHQTEVQQQQRKQELQDMSWLIMLRGSDQHAEHGEWQGKHSNPARSVESAVRFFGEQQWISPKIRLSIPSVLSGFMVVVTSTRDS